MVIPTDVGHRSGGGAMKLTRLEFDYLGLCLEGFLYGLYSAIFAMYLQYHASKSGIDRTRNTLFYALSVLYVLSVAIIVLDMVGPLTDVNDLNLIYSTGISSIMIFGCCDFISQSILIYRCWIVWHRNTRVVIVPSILAFTFLATWLAGEGPFYISSGGFGNPPWAHAMNLTSIAISMAVNALVMGLIVSKIFKVFREVRTTLREQNLGATAGSKLRSIIFILTESGMILFSIQLARLVINILPTDTSYKAYLLIAGIHSMLNGITPTIILVRTSMGLSFHDEKSMMEVTRSLQIASDHLNTIPESRSISIVCQGN